MKMSHWDGEAQSSEDLNRKFHDTYVFGKVGGGDPQVIYIHNVSPEVQWSDAKGRTSVDPRGNVDILMAIPPSGIYALEGGGVALLRRTGARQFKDGLCSSTVAITINGEKDLFRNGDISFDIAKQLFLPQKDLSLKQGKEEARDNRCVRLTRDFWLKREKDAAMMLFFRRARVGSWTVTGRFFWNAEAKFLQEEVNDKLGGVNA